MSQPFDFRSVLKPKAKLTVFNPNSETIKKDYGGNTYTFPANGFVDIFETVGRKHNSEGQWESYPISPAEIVAHFVGDDGVSGHLGPLGVRVLSGDPETDEAIMADAREVCKERHYINDLATKNAHMAAVRVAKEAGNPPPTPDRHVVAAFERIAQYETAGGKKLPFSCPDCAMPFADQGQMSYHIDAQHKGGPVAVSSSSNAEVEALKASVATLTELVKTALQVNQVVSERKKPGPKPKVAQA